MFFNEAMKQFCLFFRFALLHVHRTGLLGKCGLPLLPSRVDQNGPLGLDFCQLFGMQNE